MWGLITMIPGLLTGILGALAKKSDNALEQFRIGNTNGKEVSIAVVLAEQARIRAVKDITVNAMSHPIWWAAWALGVFPVLAYHACIFFVSTFPEWGWVIQKVPQDQVDFSKLVTAWMFGIAGASSLLTGVMHSWQKRA